MPKRPLRELRETRGWSLQELARRSNVSAAQLYHWEGGLQRIPRADTLERVAAALGVPMDAIEIPQRRKDNDDTIRQG